MSFAVIARGVSTLVLRTADRNNGTSPESLAISAAAR
jgi:hypothetical protein